LKTRVKPATKAGKREIFGIVHSTILITEPWLDRENLSL